MTADTPSTELRPINPLAALTLVLVFPGRTFRRLVERPHWIVPLLFVALAAILSGLLALAAGFMDEAIELQAFRTGHDPAEIRAAAPSAMAVSGIVGVVGAVLLESLLFLAIGRLFGGRGTFRRAFSAVCHASVPIGAVAIFLTALIPFTHTPMTGLNLAFAVRQTASPFLYGLASQVDLAVLWFFLLLGIAAEPVFGLERKRARLATLVFAIVYVMVMSWTGRSTAVEAVDPYENWATEETTTAVLHFNETAPAETRETIEGTVDLAARRIATLTGLRPAQRIDLYLYPSLEEKRRVTDSPAVAHRVEWANAVHLAWVEGAEAPLAREMAKLVGAGAHGKVYNAPIRDGVAVYAGGEWGGLPVAEAGRDLLDRKVLPRIDHIVDGAFYASMDERISQPAAGSLIALLASTAGREGVRDLYEASHERPEATAALLEAAFGDSLAGIERRWHAFLESDTEAPGAEASAEH